MTGGDGGSLFPTAVSRSVVSGVGRAAGKRAAVKQNGDTHPARSSQSVPSGRNHRWPPAGEKTRVVEISFKTLKLPIHRRIRKFYTQYDYGDFKRCAFIHEDTVIPCFPLHYCFLNFPSLRRWKQNMPLGKLCF